MIIRQYLTHFQVDTLSPAPCWLVWCPSPFASSHSALTFADGLIHLGFYTSLHSSILRLRLLLPVEVEGEERTGGAEGNKSEERLKQPPDDKADRHALTARFNFTGRMKEKKNSGKGSSIFQVPGTGCFICFVSFIFTFLIIPLFILSLSYMT